MAKQLVYTSVPQGLYPGTSGYCAVGATDNIPRAQGDFIEPLSAFRINDSDNGKTLSKTEENYDRLLRLNPPNIAHVKFQFRGKPTSVLLKTSLAGFDYSGRLRKLTHYLLVDSDEKNASDLAGLLAGTNLFLNDWDGDPKVLPERDLVADAISPHDCRAWKRFAGDAGWAGELLRAVCSDKQYPVHVVYDPKVSAIPLLIEAIALLPPDRRWDVTFSTNYVGLQANVLCQIRFIPKGSPEAVNAARSTSGLMIDLTSELGSPTECDEVAQARLGKTLNINAVHDAEPSKHPVPSVGEPVIESVAQLSTKIAIPLPEKEPDSRLRAFSSKWLPGVASSRLGQVTAAIFVLLILLAMLWALFTPDPQRSSRVRPASSTTGSIPEWANANTHQLAGMPDLNLGLQTAGHAPKEIPRKLGVSH